MCVCVRVCGCMLCVCVCMHAVCVCVCTRESVDSLCMIGADAQFTSLCVGGSKVPVVTVYALQHCTLSGGHVYPFDV